MVLAGLTMLGIGLMSAMALHPNGNVSPTPWGLMLGMAAGLVLYWSHRNRRANDNIAGDYFCTSPLRVDRQGCFNAFR